MRPHEGDVLAGISDAPDGGRESAASRVRQAAIELFAERGFYGTGIRDLAKAADLRTSSLYHYMGTKDGLLTQIMVDATLPLARAAELMLTEITDPTERLATLVEHHVWLHARERLATSVADNEVRALSGENRSRVLAIRDAYENCWRTTVREGIITGRFAVDHPEVLATALLQMCTGVASWFTEPGSLSLPELCRMYANWALTMVRATKDGVPVERESLSLLPPPRYLDLAD
jgi:AcrR family transcriptional regulator